MASSVLTLLSGQVFYSTEDSGAVRNMLTIMVLVMLAANILMVVLVIIAEWKPWSDPHAEFDKMSSAQPVEFLSMNSESHTISDSGSSGEASHLSHALDTSTINLNDTIDTVRDDVLTSNI